MIQKKPSVTAKNQKATTKKVLDFRNKIQIASRSHPCPQAVFYKKPKVDLILMDHTKNGKSIV
ncbi:MULTISPECIES: hypothetical protein [Allofournierella]|uniref:hypothetical protein n=1 Tax=Allofournierella TaxID=1940255 RepID=UPI0022EAD892|nr:MULTISPECIES: hypothetical protein [Fournierella]